jgi:ABC-type thiamine transport system substrate-binding protein
MKNFKALFFVSIFLFNLTAIAKTPNSKSLVILTYSSFAGEGSLGEWLLKDSKSPCAAARCQFIHPHPNRSLFEELRYRSQNKMMLPDLILGFDTIQQEWAKVAGLVTGTPVGMGKSPLVFLVKKSAGQKLRTLRWSEIPKVYKKSLVIQDPRFSAIGQTMLIYLRSKNLLSAKEIQSFTSRVFPKWSSSYEFFTQGESPGLLTFATSLSYHECNQVKPELAIQPIKEKYPLYEEWASMAAKIPDTKKPAADQVLAFLSSEEFQAQIPKLNWLLPSSSKVSAPECFKADSFPPTEDFPHPSQTEFLTWVDEWSL